MKSQVNFSHLIAVMVGIIIPVIIWAVSVETRFAAVDSNTESIEILRIDLKEDSKSDNKNFDKILEKLQSIELSLKDKQDRD